MLKLFVQQSQSGEEISEIVDEFFPDNGHNTLTDTGNCEAHPPPSQSGKPTLRDKLDRKAANQQ